MNVRVVVRDEEKYLKPFQITYNTLKGAIESAHNGFINGWTQANCESFLQVEGLHTKLRQQVIEHAINNKAYRLAVELEDTASLEISKLQKDKIQKPTIGLSFHNFG